MNEAVILLPGSSPVVGKEACAQSIWADYSRNSRITGPNEVSTTARTTSNSPSARSSKNSVNGRHARLPIHFGL